MLLNYIKWQHQASGSLGAEKLHRRGESKESGLGSGLMSAMLLKDRKNPVQSFFALPSATSGTQKVKVSVTQSCPTLCDPMDCSPSGSSVCGILQARILEWVVISFSRGSSQPRDGTRFLFCPLHWQVGSLQLVPPGKPPYWWLCKFYNSLFIWNHLSVWCKQYNWKIILEPPWWLSW